jgi:hypothetical protein
VLGSDGGLTGFGGGVETKRWLLDLERTGAPLPVEHQGIGERGWFESQNGKVPKRKDARARKTSMRTVAEFARTQSR